MCFKSIIYKTESAALDALKRPIILKEDRKVYKVVSKVDDMNYSSIFRNFIYTRGFHYYQIGKQPFGKPIVFYYFSRLTFGYRFEIHVGLHAYTTKKKAEIVRVMGEEVIIELIIPKGSKVFINRNSEIVTNNLIFY